MKAKALYISLLLSAPTFAAVATPSPSDGMTAEGLTLESCIDSALIHNRTLQNAALEIESAGLQRKEAYTKYFPEIKANVTAFRAIDEMIKGDGTIPKEIAALESAVPGISMYAGQPYSFSELNRGYGATLSAMQPLYAGGQIHTANQLTAVQEDVCQLQLKLKERDIRQNITENFWRICTIRYNLRTIAAAEKQIAAVRQQVQNYVDAGMTTRNALLQVTLRENELASNRLKLKNAEKTLLMLLAQQTGCHDIDILVPDEGATVNVPLMADVESSVNNRSELQLAGKAIEAQRLQVKMERGKNMPTVAVGLMGMNMGMGGLSDNVKSIMKTNMTNGIALGTVSIPISSWWGGTHAIHRQKLKLKEAENDYLDAQENLRIDLQSSWNDLTEAYQQITIAKASVEESEENLRMQTDQYRSGTVTITDLLDAETLNRKSHDQLSTAIATYNIKLQTYRLKCE